MENNSPASTPAVPVIRDERICLSIPVYGKADIPFVQCLMHTLAATNIIAFVDFLPGDSLVNRSRNNLAHRFMEGQPAKDENGRDVVVKYDWLLFVDSDLVFEPATIVRLYELGRRRGPGVYCGTYPIKQLKPKIVCNTMANCAPDAEGVVEVREAGTGFMLIHRDVFTRLAEKFSDEMRFETDMGEMQAPRTIKYDYFTVGVRMDPILGYKRFLSEDWYFCQRWREAGGKVFLHTGLQCGHIGTYTYPGNPKDVIEAADVLKKAIAFKEAQAKPAPASLVRTVRSEKIAA